VCWLQLQTIVPYSDEGVGYYVEKSDEIQKSHKRKIKKKKKIKVNKANQNWFLVALLGWVVGDLLLLLKGLSGWELELLVPL
jgi:hypothetical protein